jgi:hypothetical protein
MTNKIVMTLATLAFASVAAAGEDGFKISGDVATSVFMESGKGYNGAYPSTGAINASGAEANENSGDFSVDLVEINLEKSMGNSGVVLGIGYGRMFDLINNAIPTGGAAPKSTLNLTNAYFHHKVGDTGLSFKLGKFGSGVGFETYNYMNNMNYTRSYSFNYMNPWFFTGVAADYAINDMVSVGLVVANSEDNIDNDDNESKHMGVNATIKPMEGLAIKLNYLNGRTGDATYQNNVRLNGTVTYTLNNMWDFAFHYTSLTTEDEAIATPAADIELSSMALYAGYKTEMWGAGLRYEMADDDSLGGQIAGNNQLDNSFTGLTVTGWYNVDTNAVLKLEVAQHSADKVGTFVDDGFVADDAMMTYGLGFMYRF